MFTVNTFTISASFVRPVGATSEAAPKCRAFGEAGAHNVRACVVVSELLGESAKQVGPDTEVCYGKSNGCNTAAQRRCAHAYGSLHTDSPQKQSASGALLSFPSRVWAKRGRPSFDLAAMACFMTTRADLLTLAVPTCDMTTPQKRN
jgi:hypothetical protein